MRKKGGHLYLIIYTISKKQRRHLLQIYSDFKLLIQAITPHVNLLQTSSTPNII